MSTEAPRAPGPHHPATPPGIPDPPADRAGDPARAPATAESGARPSGDGHAAPGGDASTGPGSEQRPVREPGTVTGARPSEILPYGDVRFTATGGLVPYSSRPAGSGFLGRDRGQAPVPRQAQPLPPAVHVPAVREPAAGTDTGTPGTRPAEGDNGPGAAVRAGTSPAATPARTEQDPSPSGPPYSDPPLVGTHPGTPSGSAPVYEPPVAPPAPPPAVPAESSGTAVPDGDHRYPRTASGPGTASDLVPAPRPPHGPSATTPPGLQHQWPGGGTEAAPDPRVSAPGSTAPSGPFPGPPHLTPSAAAPPGTAEHPVGAPALPPWTAGRLGDSPLMPSVRSVLSWAAALPESFTETTRNSTRLRSAPARRPGRAAAALACVVLGLGMIGGAVTGSWLTGDSAAEPAAGDDFTVARGLWHSVPVNTLFPRTLKGDGAGPGGADRAWTRIGVAPDSGCVGTLAPLLEQTLREVGCSRVVRATYVDATVSTVTTVGLVFTRADPAATADLRTRFQTDDLGERPDLMPRAFPVEGTVAAKFGDAQRASWTVSILSEAPVVVYAVSGFADGRAVTKPQPADQAMVTGATTVPAQAGLGHDAKGIADRIERGLREAAGAGTVTSP
jgi:hypothetical protein